MYVPCGVCGLPWEWTDNEAGGLAAQDLAIVAAVVESATRNAAGQASVIRTPRDRSNHAAVAPALS